MRSIRDVATTMREKNLPAPGSQPDAPAGYARTTAGLREALPVERYLTILDCMATYGYRPKIDRHGRLLDANNVMCSLSGNIPGPDNTPLDENARPVDDRETPFLQVKDQAKLLDRMIGKVLPDAKPETEDEDQAQVRKARLIEAKNLREASEDDLIAMAKLAELADEDEESQESQESQESNA